MCQRKEVFKKILLLLLLLVVVEEEEINIFGILTIGGIVFATKQGDLPYKSVLLNIDRVTVMKDLMCQIIGGHTCNKLFITSHRIFAKKRNGI